MNEEFDQLRTGGETALAGLFEQYRDRLERMLEFRLDDRVRGRVDPADVLQEAYIELARRLPQYLAAPNVSTYVWMRQLTYQVLIGVQRRHFGQKRDPRFEVTAVHGPDPNATSLSILSAFAEQLTSPSQALVREEELQQLRQLLESMDEVDREVLALRHFEQLSNNQIAETLGISVTAASNRYVRAMLRLSQIAEPKDHDKRV
ncbi:MAG: sigma-70 family RNA polymerase sigma factor [Pirellulaceae bacterium]|nr:sigma-70 family RNA polymerase sigma factor [Pirellulaceae bacterium]